MTQKRIVIVAAATWLVALLALPFVLWLLVAGLTDCVVVGGVGVCLPS